MLQHAGTGERPEGSINPQALVQMAYRAARLVALERDRQGELRAAVFEQVEELLSRIEAAQALFSQKAMEDPMRALPSPALVQTSRILDRAAKSVSSGVTEQLGQAHRALRSDEPLSNDLRLALLDFFSAVAEAANVPYFRAAYYDRTPQDR